MMNESIDTLSRHWSKDGPSGLRGLIRPLDWAPRNKNQWDEYITLYDDPIHGQQGYFQFNNPALARFPQTQSSREKGIASITYRNDEYSPPYDFEAWQDELVGVEGQFFVLGDCSGGKPMNAQRVSDKAAQEILAGLGWRYVSTYYPVEHPTIVMSEPVVIGDGPEMKSLEGFFNQQNFPPVVVIGKREIKQVDEKLDLGIFHSEVVVEGTPVEEDELWGGNDRLDTGEAHSGGTLKPVKKTDTFAGPWVFPEPICESDFDVYLD